MTHLVCGYPNQRDSQEIFKILQNYSQFVEVQFPFSDPIADWLIITEANKMALNYINSTDDVFNFIVKNRIQNNSEILAMCYFHTILTYGLRAFIEKSKNSWIYWIIVPDVPFDTEDWRSLLKICKNVGIHCIYTVSPSTPIERLTSISTIATGFIYAISQNMTTGVQGNFWESFRKYISFLREKFSIPIGVGFGIQSEKDIKQINSIADFSIVGSQVIRLYQDWWLPKISQFLKEL